MKVFVKTNLILTLFLFICALGALLLWPCNVRAEEKEVGAFKLTTEGGFGGAERRMRMYREQCAAEKKTLEEITRSVPSYKDRLKHGDTWQFKKHLHGNLVFMRGDREKEENI